MQKSLGQLHGFFHRVIRKENLIFVFNHSDLGFQNLNRRVLVHFPDFNFGKNISQRRINNMARVIIIRAGRDSEKTSGLEEVGQGAGHIQTAPLAR